MTAGDATDALAALDREVADCRRCPRLVAWRELVAQEKVARFRDEWYWGRPVPGLGPADARILVLGLAPAAHGGNRTGRVFTGDRSGDFLYRALYDAGLASSPVSRHRDDGLALRATRVSAVVHCAPPANRPTTDERDACLTYLGREVRILGDLRVILALGAFAWDGALRSLGALGRPVPRPRPRFGHGAETEIGRLSIVGSFHPSQQNTFTGRLTSAMLDDVIGRVRELAELDPGEASDGSPDAPRLP